MPRSILAGEGLATSLPQWAGMPVQHEALPALSHRYRIPRCVSRPLPQALAFLQAQVLIYTNSSRRFSSFQGNEEDFFKAYGKAIPRGHKKVLNVIQDAHKWHPNDGECRHHLTNDAIDDFLQG